MNSILRKRTNASVELIGIARVESPIKGEAI